MSTHRKTSAGGATQVSPVRKHWKNPCSHRAPQVRHFFPPIRQSSSAFPSTSFTVIAVTKTTTTQTYLSAIRRNTSRIPTANPNPPKIIIKIGLVCSQ
jgi:hypothetical protein